MYMSNKNTVHVWCIDYCTLSTSKSCYRTQHLIHHSIVCIATIEENQIQWWVIQNEIRKNQNSNPITQSECYQSDMVSMSCTLPPRPSQPRNIRTYNLSTAWRSWRRSLYFRIIQAWRVGAIEFDFHLAQFVRSIILARWLATVNQTGVSKADMMKSGGTKVCHQEWRSAWYEV
jgi:hypothetical protein